jgi:succinate dehydrogenase / fumarate reductase cytochrome b subunit
MTEIAKKRPEFRNINALKDLPSYRLPPAGGVSILHRISGVHDVPADAVHHLDV